MDKITKSKYADYLAKCIRETIKSTGLEWPEETILCVKSYSDLAYFDQIIGMKIYVMDMPSAYDFWVAFPAQEESKYELQKAFRECLDLYPLEI